MTALYPRLKQYPRLREVLPTLGVTMVFAGILTAYAVQRVARSPEVVWDHRNNPEPWKQVQPGQQVKWMAVNQKHTSKYNRSFNVGKKAHDAF
ncbi:hypothetical protein M427DRAFT_68927 [Gonapodya prolifera JEL478]|uniref:Uncharacterized protein n=1 Tax=Gonapodya prolifera (strain JEL478) TaxID=1344416 RepID=A0A139AJN4_GONPJ|nr:hypothetical protein M427DRAFT_68927 [Gonapodya prolifera JEL478]|eukprot:KXS16615.1 hypothetical protein M427DRAFT_68927 [Gonapodya prolifera JEL478]